MSRALAVAVLLVLLLVVYRLMYAGWSRRARRHPSAMVAAQHRDPAGAVLCAADGIYVSTTSATSRLDRVTAGGLGVRARASMRVTDREIRWERQGSAAVHIPVPDVLDVGRESGMAGKVVAGRRLVVVSWRSGEDRYATGFLPRHRADADRLVAAVTQVVLAGATSTDGAP